jgi:hypothetical protein
MGYRKKGKYWYGNDYADLHKEILRYSKLQGYMVDHFADIKCSCGADTFHLFSDDVAGVAVRVCSVCDIDSYIGDSEEYLEEAEPQKSICICGEEVFHITVGVSLYRGTEDVRWLYVGCRCPACGLVGVYADWKNEYPNYRELLDKA